MTRINVNFNTSFVHPVEDRPEKMDPDLAIDLMEMAACFYRGNPNGTRMFKQLPSSHKVAIERRLSQGAHDIEHYALMPQAILAYVQEATQTQEDLSSKSAVKEICEWDP